MKLFSRGMASHWNGLKWGALALFAMGLLRFALGPVGVPIGLGGKASSLTLVVLAATIVYAVAYARSGGTLGDVALAALALAVCYTAAIALFLSLSVWLGLETYYNDPNHFRGSLGRHVLAHVQVTPFVTVAASVIGALVYGVTWLLGRMLSSRESTI